MSDQAIIQSGADAARQLQAINVIGLMSQGLKLGEACQQVGITQRQYRYILAKDPDLVRRVKSLMFIMEAPQIVQIAEARQNIIDELCRQSETVQDSFVLIAIDDHLRNVQAELEERSGFNQVIPSNDTLGLLGGMNTAPLENRVVVSVPPSGVKIEITPNEDRQIIDAESIDANERPPE